MQLLVTGAAGFIGSAFVRLAISLGHSVTVLDKLTYAGNLENLAPVAHSPLYTFHKGDICDADAVQQAWEIAAPEAVVHFAAESHVDRSILSPAPVIQTNVFGTFTLLEAARRHGIGRFLHVSTDEVYGSVPAPHDSLETDPLHTSSPYSASKAASDLLALSYHTTYKLPVTVTRASNNYGPYHFPEKLIPLMITNAFADLRLPVYGDGQQIRDWLFVDDHCRGIFAALTAGEPGEIYNIGGNCSLPNLEVVRRILHLTGKPESLIQWVQDRPGHDRRYALSSEKLLRQTGWQPAMTFDQGLALTVAWYRDNPTWVANVKSGSYRDFYQQNYANR